MAANAPTPAEIASLLAGVADDLNGLAANLRFGDPSFDGLAGARALVTRIGLIEERLNVAKVAASDAKRALLRERSA